MTLSILKQEVIWYCSMPNQCCNTNCRWTKYISCFIVLLFEWMFKNDCLYLYSIIMLENASQQFSCTGSIWLYFWKWNMFKPHKKLTINMFWFSDRKSAYSGCKNLTQTTTNNAIGEMCLCTHDKCNTAGNTQSNVIVLIIMAGIATLLVDTSWNIRG